MTRYLSRELTRQLEEALRHLPVVVLSGIRQAGKSTLLQREPVFARGRVYRTLDDFPTRVAARDAPESLVREDAILDEVQREPALLLALKQSVDADRRNGRFLVSGSANLAYVGALETLAGRAAEFTLHPLTRRERRGATKAEPFLSRLWRGVEIPAGDADPLTDAEVLQGGLPPACLADAAGAAAWLRGFVQTYVERDVRQVARVRDLIVFRIFAQLVALRTAQVLSISDLARDAKVNVAAAGRYLGVLEASYVVRRLPMYLRNRASRLVKSPKLFVADSGLAAALAGVDVLDRADGVVRGALFETYVAQNLAAILEARVAGAALYTWRQQGRHEVDFVIERAGRAVAIEVKSGTRWSSGDLGGLRAFLAATPHADAAILAHNGRTSVQVGERLFAVALGHLLA